MTAAWMAIVSFALLLATPPAHGSWQGRCDARQLPLVDAHSQFDHEVPDSLIVDRMRENGVIATILATRGKRHPTEAAQLAARHPEHVIAAVSTKQPRYEPLPLLASGQFHSAAEILLFHAQKGHRAPEVRVPPAAPHLAALYDALSQAGRPLILHIEFKSLTGADRSRYAEGLREVLTRWTATPVGLIHMAQLDAHEAAEWLQGHDNLFFLTSHADSLTREKSRQPWTNMFEGERFKPAWKELILRHPDRFVFAMDNVWSEHWREDYSAKVALWRKALLELGEPNARMVACRNAIRIWRLGSSSTIR